MSASNSTHVCSLTIEDPVTGLPVGVEIRRLDSGALLGLDESFLAQLGDDEDVYSPYDADTVVRVAHDE